MTASPPTPCPRCGAAATGNFCAECGASLGAPVCSSCGAAIATGARFCHRCGAAVSPDGSASGRGRGRLTTPAKNAAGRRDTVPWLIAALLTVITITAVVLAAGKRGAPEVPSMANAGNAAAAPDSTGGGVRAPNIDSLSPKERFVRLEGRIDQKLEQGDTTQLAFFMEMALQAYAMLPPADRDIDTRYHAAMLQAQVGMFDGARALADTIMKESPDNLFGYYIRATVAEFAGDSAAAKGARAAFRTHYDAEIRKNRPEYAEHLPFLQQYRNGDGAR